ncbi:MAG: peptide deformylase [Candidatus Paceibacterota bacterium]
MTSIVQKGDDVLQRKAVEVDPRDIGTEKIDSIISRMNEALDGEEDGVAIAAPQIGESVHIFIVSRKVFEDRGDGKDENMVFINPEIVKRSKSTEWMEEGCLSVRWWYGEVERHTQITLRAISEEGEAFEMGASGLLAQIFQHETDHLKGRLFDENARNLKEITPENHDG